jgi:hypothetical protein
MIPFLKNIENTSQVLDENVHFKGSDSVLFETLDLSFRWHLRTAVQVANALIPRPAGSAFADAIGALQLVLHLVRGG